MPCNNDNSLGNGQTWQSVTRTSTVTYYNTTGRPIQTAYAIASNGGNATITVGGIVVARTSFDSGVNSTINTLSAVIPTGAAYVFTLTGAGSIASQSELR